MSPHLNVQKRDIVVTSTTTDNANPRWGTTLHARTEPSATTQGFRVQQGGVCVVNDILHTRLQTTTAELAKLRHLSHR